MTDVALAFRVKMRKKKEQWRQLLKGEICGHTQSHWLAYKTASFLIGKKIFGKQIINMTAIKTHKILHPNE